MKNKILQMVASAILLASPIVNYAQNINLGTAKNFVLFTTAGAVTNTGISHLTGNVGTNAGSSTGFGNVNGVMNDNNGAAFDAAADLLTAYNQLNDATPTHFPATLIGNGDTLKAGVYKTGAVTTLSGNLVLNAEGNPNAVFIFQIQAAFSVNSSAKVKLINGAQACNVFWKTEGMVSVASNASLKGNIVAHNAAIDLGVNDTLDGRALSIAGAITLNNILAYTPTGCGSPLLTGPAAPAMGATACYAIFSGNQSVTNAGVSNVTGDIGTNAGLTTGYDSNKVAGKIHTIPDGSTSAAASALLDIYSYLNTLPNDIQLLYPAQFGNNLVLTPHTYLMNAAAAFNGTLYLNAEGNSNAVFVIKINGALSTSTFSKVILMNGAQAKNIFWKVEGAVSIGDYSEFAGTIVCNNAAVNLGTGVSINGRAFTTNGALSTASVSVVMTEGCNTLPVSWLYFKGKAVQKNVLLEWGTSNELNNGFFTIEKSKDGSKFETFASINANNNTANKVSNYSITDLNPSVVNYYRISQTDKDGLKSYFRTIQVKLNNGSANITHTVRPSFIWVEATSVQNTNGSIKLYSLEGKMISSQKVTLTQGVSTFKVEKPAQKGMYLLNVEGNGEKLYSGKVMVL